MDVGKNKLRSIIKQVQNSADGVLSSSSSVSGRRSNRSVSVDDDSTQQLDLSSAIEYNYCLIDSYLQERNDRKLSPYEEILKNPEENEDDIIESIGPEFFLDTKNCDINKQNCNIPDEQENTESIIIEKCVLSKLPEFSEAAPNLGDEFLSYLEKEKNKLNKQQTIVSKRLTEMIVKNDSHFKSELSRVRSIEKSLANAVDICSKGREALDHSKRDFTKTSLDIVENYRRREAIVQIIECLQNIKRLRQTVERIEHMLKYEKNFSSAINLFNDKFEVMESMSSNYQCVAEMKEKLMQTLQVVDNQMDSVLQKMTDRFCHETYLQLCKAYSQIGKSDHSIHQLLLHFTNAIHDKAFSIVLGYVKLFAGDMELGPAVACSTPIKTLKKNNEPVQIQESDFKRKPFAELCQYLNPESFLQCLTDLCRALWDLMNNYYQALSFYQKEDLRTNINLSQEEIEFAVNKLTQGVLRVWSDVQHKIRTLVSSVQFVQSHPETIENSNDPNETFHDHQQDQLLFSFEEFIKILTVCEKMIEIGDQFCQLYHQNSDEKCQESSEAIADFQSTLYRQTRAYFQSYHQVSMSELKIFLENEIWTRCPIDTRDEFELISNLQEFAFLKNRLTKKKLRPNYTRTRSKDSPSKSSASTFLLSPVAKSKSCLNDSYFTDYDDSGERLTPFDGIMNKNVIQTCDEYVDDDDDDDDETTQESNNNEDIVADKNSTVSQNASGGIEIITTNTTLNVLRLMGRYMNIMFLLRPISHDIVKSLLELFDYYFYTIYHFFAMDGLNISWIGTAQYRISAYSESSSNVSTSDSSTNNKQLKLLNNFSTFIRRINENLIQNDSNSQLELSPNSSPSKKVTRTKTKYPCPTLASYVLLNSKSNHFALGERIMAIQSLIFIARQFYCLCPFLLEFLRTDSLDDFQQSNNNALQASEDGFKLLQFHYDKMCQSVESLQFQCLYAVSTKLFPYESLVSQMTQTKWDLKEIPSIHSSYVNVFVQELQNFDPAYRKLLESYDLGFLIPENYRLMPLNPDDAEMPLNRLYLLSGKMNIMLWECIVKISNRTFVEGFSSARKCTNEGRALMQLDYEQFLSHIEKLMLPYFKAATPVPVNQEEASANYHVKALKSFLANERPYVEDFVKAFYITEPIFIEWIRQRPDYTTKQIVGLINCITNDNKKLRSSLLAAIDTSSIENSGSHLNTTSSTIASANLT